MDNLKTIIREMQHSLPNKTYLQFIAERMFPDSSSPFLNQSGDPFALNVPSNFTDDVYVIRQKIHDEITLPLNRIILGRRGSGMSLLVDILPVLLRTIHKGNVLVVPITQTEIPFGEDMLLNGSISFLSPEVLVPLIFSAYWEDLLLNESRRERFLTRLRRDREWMTQLRWLYHQYPPRSAEKLDDFELTAWLHHPAEQIPANWNVPIERSLREMVKFVTYDIPQRRYGPTKTETSPYRSVELLIDATHSRITNRIPRLLEDVEKISSLSLQELRFKIFIHDTFKSQVLDKISSIRRGGISIFSLPPWTANELHDLLRLRLIASLPHGEPINLPSSVDSASASDGPHWGTFIPTLAVDAKSRFEQIIVDYALQTYQNDSSLDAPVHALRLARGLLAACAGCWPELGPMIDLSQLQELAASLSKESPLEEKK